jgi:hypothetical protein
MVMVWAGYEEPGVREAALAMVEEETRRYRPTRSGPFELIGFVDGQIGFADQISFGRNYLEHLPALNLSSFESDLMRAEFERLSNRQPMDTLSMKRSAANSIFTFGSNLICVHVQIRTAHAAPGKDDGRAGLDRVL